MKVSLSAFVLIAISWTPVSLAQVAALYEVSLKDRIGRSEVIVEGRVVSQESFWNAERTLIFTASRVELYRVFKGSYEGSTIDVITPGGVVGFEAQSVSPALSLLIGDVGVFFLLDSPAVRGLEKWASLSAYKPYASVQGFVRYDESAGSASDVFHVYRDVESQLYTRLEQELGAAAVVADYSLRRREASKSGQVPVITSFSPTPVTAGTGAVLTINGAGFEAQGGNSTVFFANADDGGAGTTPATPDSEIQSWTDSKIELKVPTGSGTGLFAVRSNSGLEGTSATSLSVDYNLINIAFDGFKRTILKNKDSGGYSLVMSTNVSGDGVDFATSDAVEPFNRALATWQTETGFNVRNDGGITTANTVAPNDDPDIVMFDNANNPLDDGVLGRAFSGFSSVDGEDWFVAGFDIQFRRDGTSDITWNYGPANTPFCCFDFESVALHELGHAHQLGHIIEQGAVMNYTITSGRDVRTLDPASDIAGGNDVLDYAATKPGGMDRLIAVGVEDEGVARVRSLRLTSAFPNPTSSEAVFSVQVDRPQKVKVDVYDLLGRRVARIFDGVLSAGIPYGMTVRLRDLPAGVYIYSVAGEDAAYSRPIVYQP